MPNFRMTLSYDGTRYNGWQRQGNTPDTIQGRLEAVLSDLLAQPVEVAGSGRTDAGVHARMQTASFRAKTNLSAPELLRRLRAQLPGDIGVLTLTEAEPRFHARLSCRGKTYVYRVWNSDTPNVFERRYVYALPQPLDTAAMQRAAALLCGRHDYTSFCANRHMKKSAVRTVDAITVERLGEEVRLTFSGDGFLYHMVRILTGTLLEVGLGQRDADTMPAILAARDRSAAGRHDYTSFCANRHMKKSAVRTVDAITVERLGEEVRLTFSGDGFLYHMVRILTGTLLEVGLGQRDADTMPAILAARDRSAAGPTAPARGLILWETRYARTHPEAGEEKRE